jgi:hypothetical protein
MNHIEGGQGRSNHEAGENYSVTLSSIRADQGWKTFVGDLDQNKEQLLSFAKNLVFNRGSTQEEKRTYLLTGIYLDTVLKLHVFDIHPFSNNPAADYPDESSNEPLTKAERNEIIALRATQMVASRWLKNHPDSEAARAVAREGIFADTLHQWELLQEMWPSIRDIANQSEKKK